MSHHHRKHHEGGAGHKHAQSSDHGHSGQKGTGEGEGHAFATGGLSDHVRHRFTSEYLNSRSHHLSLQRVSDTGLGNERELLISPPQYGERQTLKRTAEKEEGKDKKPDGGKTVQENVLAGNFKIARDGQQESDTAALRDKAKNPVKNIEVVYQDQSGDKTRPRVEPDFRVKRDGTVEVLRNPDKGSGEKLVVEVERPAGDRNAPPKDQQQAVDNLVGYLSGRYMPEVTKPDGTIQRDGQINDEQGLVSDAVKKGLNTKPTPEDSLTPEAREQVERINRWKGSGGGRNGGDGGRFSAREGREQFAPRDVPRQPGEDDKLAAIKDVASGFFSRGEKDPYHVVRNTSDRGFRVGRYGISRNQYHDWLMGLTDEEIEKLIKEGKLPKGALDYKKGKASPEGDKFKAFMDKMGDGKEQPSNAEIDQFMPKGLQERVGTDLVKEYAFATADRDENGKATRVNIGKVALSMQLGHAVTDEEAKKPEYQEFMQAAERAYPLALRRAMEGDIDIDLSEAGKKIVAAARGSLGQRLWTRHAAVTQNGNLGCAASVSSVLRDAGVANVDETLVTGLAGKLKGKGWQALPFSQRQPGDVIIALKAGGARGHTGVVGENREVTYDNHSGSGRWSQDPASYWTRGRWPTVYVLRAPAR